MSTFKSRLLAAAGLLAFAAGAHAAPATWQFLGTMTQAEAPADPNGYAYNFRPGNPFRVVVTFDTDATVTATQSGSVGGVRYFYDPSSIRFAIFSGACAPCEPAAESGYAAAAGVFIARDNYDDPARNGTTGPVDGYTIGVRRFDGTSINLLMRGPVLDIVTGPALPATPKAALADLAIATLEICLPNDGPCYRGDIDSVIAPSSGTGYLFTARDCRVAQRNASDQFPYDCVNSPGAPAQLWSFPAQSQIAGGLGWPEFARSLSPNSAEIDAQWGGTAHAATNLPAASLGQLYGAVTFGSTKTRMPLLRGASVPSDFARTNANLLAYQRYAGAANTALPVEIDFTYSIDDNRTPVPSPGPGQWPGVGSIGVVLSAVDGAVPLERIRDIGRTFGFGVLVCGAEAELGLPANSILGAASHFSAAGAKGDLAVAIPLRRCGAPDQFLRMPASGSVTFAASMQTPARGKAAQPADPSLPARDGLGVTAPANGWVTSVNTFAVAPDRTAPPELVAAFVESVAPACGTACGDAGVELEYVTIDVKPGSTDNAVNPGAAGGIPVAIFGSARVAVKDLRLDETLKLGSLGLRVRGERPQCSVQRVNGDEYDDLVCLFLNESSGWTENSGSVTVTGMLANGIRVKGSDQVRLVR
jgi:hypothetical protein